MAGNIRAGCNPVTIALCWEDAQHFIYGGLDDFQSKENGGVGS